MTSMPFIGVRISWLIVARKVDFAALAASATCLASLRSAVRSLTSCSRVARWRASAWSRVRTAPRSPLKVAASAPTSSFVVTGARVA
ncbi:hypothetical protein AEGHOMDF_0962 [Methylobacterium soli]|nr:hypothetical protein AEGHOMDF_0962 [Methylobacterium soli]